MNKEYIKLGLKNIRKRKLRSGLTLLGIFIGIMTIVALISLGQGLQKSITDQFASLGTDKLFVMPKGGFSAPGSRTNSIQLTKDDQKVIDKVSGVMDSAGIITQPGEIQSDKEKRYLQVTGFPTDNQIKLLNELGSYNVEFGRKLKKGDSKKVVLGSSFYTGEVFSKSLKLGDRILINGISFEVIGFYESAGNSADDKNVVISEDDLREMIGDKNRVDMIIVKIAPSEKPSVVKDRIEKDLRNSRDLKEGKEDFSIQTPEDVLKSFQSILLIIQIFLISIAGISLLVGGVGIMNTMYTAILERNKEIGVMKAIGAKNSDIMGIFVTEAGLLGLIGGIIGTALGMAVSKIIEIIGTNVWHTSLLKMYFPWYLILGAILFSVVMGMLAGAIPAYQASKMKPVDSLRYE